MKVYLFFKFKKDTSVSFLLGAIHKVLRNEGGRVFGKSGRGGGKDLI